MYYVIFYYSYLRFLFFIIIHEQIIILGSIYIYIYLFAIILILFKLRIV